MLVTRLLRRASGLVAILIRDPGQVKYLWRWARHLRRSPLTVGMPWLPYRVVDRLQRSISKDSRAFEFGGGGSTVWFSSRVAQIVTAEHDEEWFRDLRSVLGETENVTLLYRRPDDDYADYVASIRAFPDDHFDVVVVDGRERVRCFTESWSKVKRGGLLVLDDSDRDRYAPVFALVESWPRTTYRGLTPSKSFAGVTTIWQRP
jgi:hypothetical protein